MNLIRDVLDKQLVDRTGRDCGKIDGLILVSEAGQPPRLRWIECGSVTLAARLGPRTARAVAWLARRLGPRRGEPVRIPWEKVERIDVDVTVSLTAENTPLDAGETWSREHVVAHIPGA